MITLKHTTQPKQNLALHKNEISDFKTQSRRERRKDPWTRALCPQCFEIRFPNRQEKAPEESSLVARRRKPRELLFHKMTGLSNLSHHRPNYDAANILSAIDNNSGVSTILNAEESKAT